MTGNARKTGPAVEAHFHRQLSRLLEQPVDRTTGHPQLAGDGGRPKAIVRQLLDALAVETRLAALVHTLPLCHRDPLQLPLAPDIGLEDREGGEHAEERPAHEAKRAPKRCPACRAPSLMPGARALLVSHWAVDTDATVELITKTLSTMAAARPEPQRREVILSPRSPLLPLIQWREIQQQEARRRLADGESARAVGRTFAVHHSTVSRLRAS